MFDLKRFHRGDRGYLEGLVRAHGGVVQGVAKRFGKDEDHLQDLFQECWMRVFQNRRTYRGEGSLEGWIHRVATRVCITDYRQRKSQFEALNRMAPGEGPQGRVSTPEEDQQQKEEDETHCKLHLALGELSEREHEAIYLRILEDKSAGDVARIMGIKKSSVRSMIRHGVKRLRRIMGS